MRYEQFPPPVDDWLEAVPDDPYGECPCGCGKKFRFILREGEAGLSKHFHAFIERKDKDGSYRVLGDRSHHPGGCRVRVGFDHRMSSYVAAAVVNPGAIPRETEK